MGTLKVLMNFGFNNINVISVIEGNPITVMAGLNCGTPSALGWPMLRDCSFAFLSCLDEVTFTGMKSYYFGIF